MADFKKILRNLKKNLNILEERAIGYGRHLPFNEYIQIEDCKKAILLTKQAISGEITEDDWREMLAPLTVATWIPELAFTTFPQKISSSLEIDYSNRIQNFINEYLGTVDNPVPFGGRDTELRDLNNWLEDESVPQLALIAGGAGRGKSALLTNWVEILKEKLNLNVIFIPISIRFNTALANIAFTALAIRLSKIYGEDIVSHDLSADQWKEVCLSLLHRQPPDDKQLLIILDGLDEATDWRAGPDLFPSTLPQKTRIVVSARYLSGDINEQGWLRRLGWNRPNQAKVINLAGLTRLGIENILVAMGDPLKKLSTQVNIVDELFRLSSGDPLLIRLYVEALLPFGDQAAALSVEDLPNIQEGLSGFFTRWWDDQKYQWQQQGIDPLSEESSLLTFFNLCAVALGPLLREDIIALAPEKFKSGLQLDQTAKSANRFFVGDGKTHGYVFSHSRLNQYFREEMTSSEQKIWEERFLNYGRETVNALNLKTLEPKKVSSYIVQYFSSHLIRNNASLEGMKPLTTSVWYRTSELLTETHSSFLIGISHVWQRANDNQAIGEQIRCALITTSLRSLATSIPSQLIANLVKLKRWTPTQALTYIRQASRLEDRIEAIVTIWPFVPEQLQISIMEDALADVASCKDSYEKAKLLTSLIPNLPISLLDKAFKLAVGIFFFNRCDPIRELALRQAQSGNYNEAIFVAGFQHHLYWKIETLIHLIPELPEIERESILAGISHLLLYMRGRGDRLNVLIKLLPHLSDHEKMKTVQECLKLGEEFGYPTSLIELLPFVEALDKERLINEILETVKKQTQPQDQATALKRLIPLMSFDVQTIPLSLVSIFGHHNWQGEVLAALACRLAMLGYPSEALEQVRTNSNNKVRLIAIAPLLPYLTQKERDQILSEILRSLPQLTDDHELCKKILEQVAPHLSETQLESAIEIAHRIEIRRIQSEILTFLAPYCQESRQLEVLDETLKIARIIQDEVWQVEPLVEAGKNLANTNIKNSAIMTAFIAAQKISRPDMRVRVLTAVAPHLLEPLRSQAFKEALVAVRQMSWGTDERFRALISVLPTSFLEEAFQIAQSWGNNMRMHLMAYVADRLPDPDKIRIWRHILETSSQFNPVFQAQFLAGEAHLLPLPLMDQALTLARKFPVKPNVPNGSLRINVLTALALRESGSKRIELMNEALAIAKNEIGHQYWVQILAQICNSIPELINEEAKKEALQSTELIESPRIRAQTLAMLAPHFPEPKRSDLYQLVFELIDKAQIHELSYVLDTLSVNLPLNLVPRALELVRSLPDPQDRVKLSIQFAFYVDEATKLILIEEIFSLMPQKDRAFSGREWAWIDLVQLSEQVDTEKLYSIWKSILPKLADKDRYYLLSDIRELIPIIQRLGGENAVKETAEAIMEVCERWP